MVEASQNKSKLTVLDEYIEGIPYEKLPTFAFSKDVPSYIVAVQNVIGSLPIKDQRIHFSDDVWDFNPYFPNRNTSSNRIIFVNIYESIKDYCKLFVLHAILGSTKISTANLRSGYASSILNAIMKNTVHDSIYLITTKDIDDEINNRNITHGAKHNYYESLYQLLNFIKKNYKISLLVNLETIKKHGVEEKKLSKLETEECKLPNIPDEYFRIIVNTSISIMRNSSAEYNTRATACEIVMLSQLGLRIDDLLALKTTDLLSTVLPKSGLTAYYIHYKSEKPSKPHAPELEFNMFSSKLCTEAFNILLSIRTQCIYAKQNDFLYILNPVVNSKNEFPVLDTRFNNEYMRLLWKNVPDACLQRWEGILPRKYLIKTEHWKKIFVQAYFPDTRQFRVYLCTALYVHRIPLAVIQDMMGQLSEALRGYYVREKGHYFENIELFKQSITDMVGEDYTPIGSKYAAKFKQKIEDFLVKNNLNIYDNIDDVIKAFGGEAIIRAKVGGVCINSGVMPCAQENQTNDLYCLYNICPNIFTFFYMVDITYIDFRTSQKVYLSDLDEGCTIEAQKELYKLLSLCKHRLIPQLDELDKEIERRGKEEIIKKYPTLEEIILSEADIRKEIEIWMKEKIKSN